LAMNCSSMIQHNLGKLRAQKGEAIWLPLPRF
jgi:hypothetical protein